tara:strand:+ start:1456 stop:2535 length:1080 start_codon:yes stop_codon:yes gene_type:complete
MAKKTTTSTTKPTTPGYGARGKADLGIVAAAGQRYAPITPDISGYMQVLGDTAKILIQRRENAIQRAQDIDLSGDIVGSEDFKTEIEDGRDKALELSKTMKNTLPFTKKHKDAKKEFEEIKKNIQGYNEQFKVIDQISTNLGGMVEDGKIQMSIGESEVKQNYYLALYTKDFGNGFDPDGDGPKKPMPFFKIENGKMLMVNESGNYVDPKVIKVNFKKGGDTKLSESISAVSKTISSTKVTAETKENLVNTSLTDIRNYGKNNPVEFTEHLMTTEYKLESEGGNSYTFMDYYLNLALQDVDDLGPENVSESLIKKLKNFNIDDATETAKQILFKSVKQEDPYFMDSVEDFYEDHFDTFN